MIFSAIVHAQISWVNKTNLLKFGLPICFFTSFFLSCSNQPSEKNPEENGADTPTVAMKQDNRPQNDSVKIVVKAFMENKQWGYDIILNDKLYIHQPNIPSVSGNDGFKTKEDAIKTGEFVAYEIRNHILPPTVTPEQLDSLGVIEKK